MLKIVTPLTASQVKNAKPRDKIYSLSDGGGLALWVLVSGSKSWRIQYGQREGYLQGNNLTNKIAHPFNFTLKYLAPLPGSSIVAGLRWQF